jgi:hypothetical protein
VGRPGESRIFGRGNASDGRGEIGEGTAEMELGGRDGDRTVEENSDLEEALGVLGVLGLLWRGDRGDLGDLGVPGDLIPRELAILLP